MKVGVEITVYENSLILPFVLESIYDVADDIVILFQTERAWRGNYPASVPHYTEAVIKEFEDPGKKITLIKGVWYGEGAQRNQGLEVLRKMGYKEGDLFFRPDADEVFEPVELKNLIDDFARCSAERCRIKWFNFYWDCLHYGIPKYPSKGPVFKFSSELRFKRLQCDGVMCTRDVSIKEYDLTCFHYRFTKRVEEMLDWFAMNTHHKVNFEFYVDGKLPKPISEIPVFTEEHPSVIRDSISILKRPFVNPLTEAEKVLFANRIKRIRG